MEMHLMNQAETVKPLETCSPGLSEKCSEVIPLLLESNQNVLHKTDNKQKQNTSETTAEGKLSFDQKDKLKYWINQSSITFKLIYSVTRNGKTAADFHTVCDGEGPTVTIVYDVHGGVFGGYTKKGFNGKETQITDPKAFLFCLRFVDKSKEPCKFQHTDEGKYAINDFMHQGPSFGSSKDLHTFSDTLEKQGDVYQMIKPKTGIFGSSLYKSQDNSEPFEKVIWSDRLVNDIEVYKVVNEESPNQLRKEVGRVQVYSNQKSETTDKIHTDLIQWLQDQYVGLDSTRLYNNWEDLTDQVPVIVLSIFKTRIKEDVRDACKNLPLTGPHRKTVIMFHNTFIEADANPEKNQEFEKHPNSYEGLKLFHMTLFVTDNKKKIYQCRANKDTLAKVIRDLFKEKQDTVTSRYGPWLTRGDKINKTRRKSV